jgi:hypothetical protein
MKMKPIGFISENTAAYALVPNLIGQLTNHHTSVIPLRYSATREGSRTAEESMAGERLKILTAFPRRPKIIHAGDESILVKMNSVLFSSAIISSAFRIPVLAGVPLISSLLHFTLSVPCAWFLIEPVEQSDTEFYLHISDKRVVTVPANGISGPLNIDEILGVITSKCKEMDWGQARESMRLIKEQGNGYHGPFGGGYIPFFAAIISNGAKR